MSKTVGFACNIKPAWLDKAMQLKIDGLNEQDYRNELNKYLSFEIDSPTRLRKTREILMNVWFYENDNMTEIRNEAIRIIQKRPEDAIPIHICLIYMAYAVVADVCSIIGRMFEYSDEIGNAAIKEKLFDAWGERGTLETTARRVSLTLKDFGVLTAPSKFRYRLKKVPVFNADTTAFLLWIAMKLDGKSYYTFPELNEFYTLFPFEYTIQKESILSDEKFIATNYNGELTVGVN